MQGKVQFLKLENLIWHGDYPDMNDEKKLDAADFIRYIDTGSEGITNVDVENIIVEFYKGKLFGELALLDSSKKTRALSAMTKSDCILLMLN